MSSALITNERGQREWLYLLHRFGENRVLQAMREIPGQRKPFPLNVARVLKVSLPKPDDLLSLYEPVRTPVEKAAGLAAIRVFDDNYPGRFVLPQLRMLPELFSSIA